jgi:hypothetical protein
MQKRLKRFGKVLLGIAILWTILTIIVQVKGKTYSSSFGTEQATQKALVVYDPDPIYNLDQQVSEGVALGLAQEGWAVEVRSVRAATEISTSEFQLFVFVANTYNWAPDWAVTRFIKNTDLEGQNAATITLGSGSTKRAQRLLEEKVTATGAQLLDSRTYWLLRPNDEERLQDPNVQVAVDLAMETGASLAQQLK